MLVGKPAATHGGQGERRGSHSRLGTGGFIKAGNSQTRVEAGREILPPLARILGVTVYSPYLSSVHVFGPDDLGNTLLSPRCFWPTMGMVGGQGSGEEPMFAPFEVTGQLAVSSSTGPPQTFT